MKTAKFSYVAPKPVYGFRFFWKELTADGRLIEPRRCSSVSQFIPFGYETEEEAVATRPDYDDFVGNCAFVLTRVYCRVD